MPANSEDPSEAPSPVRESLVVPDAAGVQRFVDDQQVGLGAFAREVAELKALRASRFGPRRGLVSATGLAASR